MSLGLEGRGVELTLSGFIANASLASGKKLHHLLRECKTCENKQSHEKALPYGKRMQQVGALVG